jgi:superfamily II DNA or RNA helicase
MHCTIKIADEVTCTLTGLQTNHLQTLIDDHSEYVPGFKFMPLYKMGAWDGKTNFVTKKGRTYQALLSQIIPKLVKWGYKLTLNDIRSPLEINVQHVDKDLFSEHGWTLREHQIEAVNAVIDSDHKGIIVAATGAGKSLVICALSKVYEGIGFRSLVIVPSVDLVHQSMEPYTAMKMDIGQYTGAIKDTDHQHVMSTWQALQNNPALLLNFQVVIIDETHGAKGAVIQKLLIEHGSHIPVRVGCTGTMPKDPADYKSIHAAVGSGEIYTITAAELMRRGLLATVNINQMLLRDSDNPKEDKFAEYDHEKKALIANAPRNKWIADFIVDLSANAGNTLVLVSSIPVGKKLQKMIGDEKSVFIYGKDDTEVRKQVYALFETHNNITVIANVQIASVGLSIDRIFNLVMLDIGKAFTRVVQAIGRSLRMASDKTHAEVWDIGTNYSFGSTHAKKRVVYYKDAEYPYKTTYINYK